MDMRDHSFIKLTGSGATIKTDDYFAATGSDPAYAFLLGSSTAAPDDDEDNDYIYQQIHISGINFNYLDTSEGEAHQRRGI